MSLNEVLAKMKQERAARRPPEATKLLVEESERMAQLGINDTSLKPGDKAPSFTLSNAVGHSVSSDDLLKQGPLVISFYRGAWCPYCNMELVALQQTLPAIKEAGGQLIAISPNLPDKSLSSVEKHKLAYEVLTRLFR